MTQRQPKAMAVRLSTAITAAARFTSARGGGKEEAENIGTGAWTALLHKKDGGLQSPPERVLFTPLKEGRLG